MGAMPRTTAEWRAIDDKVIAQFRAKRGATGRANPVILVTTIGRKSGRPLVTPLNFSEDGDRLVVIASAGGSETHPAWYLNLQANPDVTIEHGEEAFRARAHTAAEPERTRLFDVQATGAGVGDAGGPTQRNPASTTRCAKSAFSARKPYPG